MRLSCAEVARLVGGRLLGTAEVPLCGAEVDSRRLRPGYLFVALPGERCDGHQFVAPALQVGAAALVRDDAELAPPPAGRALIRVADPLAAYHRLAEAECQRRAWRLVAVTGSVGKTTTKDILVHLLDCQGSAYYGKTGGSEGNRNSTLGLPAQVLNQPEGVEVFVAETGMSSLGELDTLGRILCPELVLYTRLAPAHTEFFPDMDGIVRAKAELLRHLPATGTLVVNQDDHHQHSYAGQTTARVLPYGAGTTCRIEEVQEHGLLGSSFRLVLGTASARVRLDLPGSHQRENLLAAASAASVLGVTAEQVAIAAPGLVPAAHRGRLHRLAGNIVVVDDSYNASPVAVSRLLELLAAAPGRRVAVLGEMYELGRLCDRAHRDAGTQAAGACDLLITVGGEPARTMEGAARQAGLGSEAVCHADDAEEAVALLRRRLQEGDVVLVKGSRGVGLDRTVAMLLGDGPAEGEETA